MFSAGNGVADCSHRKLPKSRAVLSIASLDPTLKCRPTQSGAPFIFHRTTNPSERQIEVEEGSVYCQGDGVY